MDLSKTQKCAELLPPLCVHKFESYFRGCIYLKPYKHIILSANTSPPSTQQNGKKFQKFRWSQPSLLYVSTNKEVILGDASI